MSELVFNKGISFSKSNGQLASDMTIVEAVCAGGIGWILILSKTDAGDLNALNLPSIIILPLNALMDLHISNFLLPLSDC